MFFITQILSKHKNKFMKQLIILILALIVISCNKSVETNITGNNVDVDSLTLVFLQGWNNSDSAAIMMTIADNAIVMNDSVIHNGVDDIAKNWVSGGVKVLSNIQTISIIKGSTDNLAYNGGTYSLDLTLPDGALLNERGNFSLVWAKQESGQWKLKLIHIEDITRMPNIQ
jgi:ketosteroid isomerase-like protein